MLTVILIFTVGFGILSSALSKANAGEYEQAVVGHIITNSSEIDHAKLLESEMQKLAYVMMLQMADVLEKTMPYIIEDITASLRQESDKLYKCKLLENTEMACK